MARATPWEASSFGSFIRIPTRKPRSKLALALSSEARDAEKKDAAIVVDHLAVEVDDPESVQALRRKHEAYGRGEAVDSERDY
jgi:hypothetical protein